MILGYNEIRSINEIAAILPDVMPKALSNLQWLDLQHNSIITLGEGLTSFPHIKSLYLHCNYIFDMAELLELSKLKYLRNLTVHGNPLDRIDNFRLVVISFLPHLKKLDTVLITHKERDNAIYLQKFYRMERLPAYTEDDCPKPPTPENDKNNNDEFGGLKY